MSANNWAACPRCEKHTLPEYTELQICKMPESQGAGYEFIVGYSAQCRNCEWEFKFDYVERVA